MEKELLSNKKSIYTILYCCAFISFFISCKKDNSFVYNATSIIVDPVERIIRNKKVQEIEIYSTDSLGKLDSSSLRKYLINSNGLIVVLEDRPAFSTTLKLKYEGNCLPSYLYSLSDYALEYSSFTKVDSNNKKITTFWKDEFKQIEDSTIYFFNDKNQLVKVDNSIDLFNHFIRKKIGYGVFKVNFNEELFYNNDSLLYMKKIVFKSNSKAGYEKMIPVNAIINYDYNTNKELIKIVEYYKFLSQADNINKEIFFKDGLPSEYLLNGKTKFIYKYKFY